jgi:hypothetical protein
VPTPITVKIGDLEFKGELNDSAAAQAMAEALPFEWRGSRWGDEYYGPPSQAFGEHPGESGTVMNVGDLGWFAANDWFCLFFGPTPASSGSEPVAAVPLQTVGNVTGDWDSLRKMGGSITATISKS